MLQQFPDRRASPRHPAVANRVRLEWWEGPELRHSWSRLLDVSHGGASLAAAAPLPADRPILLRLEEPVGSDWISASLVRQGGDGRAGVAFRRPCPFFVDAATLGIDFGDLLGAYGDRGA
jgi:hypothetical protein